MSWFFSGLQRFTAQPVQGCNTLDGICDLERELDLHLTKCPIEVSLVLYTGQLLFGLTNSRKYFICYFKSHEAIKVKHLIFYYCNVTSRL